MMLPWFGILAIVALIVFGLIVVVTRSKGKGGILGLLAVLALFAIIIILFTMRVG